MFLYFWHLTEIDGLYQLPSWAEGEGNYCLFAKIHTDDTVYSFWVMKSVFKL